MANIRIYDGIKYITFEVSDEFAKKYNEMEHSEALKERKETRRHQSLNKSLDNGWDIKDKETNVEDDVEKRETIRLLHKAIQAPVRLYDLYIYLYVKNYTQIGLSIEWNYSSDYIKQLNRQLCQYLFNFLNQ